MIYPVGLLTSTAQADGELSGRLSGGSGLNGGLSAANGVAGSLSAVNGVIGTTATSGGASGGLSSGGDAPYGGTYTVIPSAERQVLSTAGKSLAEDVVIEPIPSNYGLITWNGATLTVS